MLPIQAIRKEFIDYIAKGGEVLNYHDSRVSSHLPTPADGEKYPLRQLYLSNGMVRSVFQETVLSVDELFPNYDDIVFRVMEPGTDTLPIQRIGCGVRIEYPIILPYPNRTCGVWLDDEKVKHYTDETPLLYNTSTPHLYFNYSRGTSVVLAIDLSV